MLSGRRIAIVAPLVLAAWGVPFAAARAQCADGSAPPCASQRMASREHTLAVDPNRIAVLPFRVTTSDSLLGEGFAELLATEFSGDNGPSAVDMATVISAWRRAGGGLRTPLARDRALRLARELGAGLVSEGSIVGVGKQITITTSIVNSTTGSSRGRPTRITAPADSVDAALRQTASGLVAALGGQQRTLEGARYTDSPEAMRLYLEGLSAWRRGRLIDAVSALERAMTLDTTFAQAAFRRMLTLSWSLPAGTLTPPQINTRAFALRERLSPSERLLLEAILGPDYPAIHTLVESHAMLERAAALLPDSPEALFRRGDLWLHYGAPIDPENQLARARDFIERAAAIDSQATALRHLMEIAVRFRDTTMLRRVLPAYAKTEDTGRWPGLFLGWSILGDEAQLAQLRRRPAVDSTNGSQWATYAALVADIPAARLDELDSLWVRALEGKSFQALVANHVGLVLATRGRPAAAERAFAGREGARLVDADRYRIMLALSDMADGLDVAGAVKRLSDFAQQAPRANPLVNCDVALWRMREGAPAPDPSIHYPGTCGRTVDIARIPANREASTLLALEAADSLLRNSLVGVRGYESYYLARAWEAAGQPERAFRAIRYRTPASFAAESPWLYPEEARLAAVVGDTAGIVRVLEYYLPIIKDAEPPFAAKRDSLRAMLARYKRKRSD